MSSDGASRFKPDTRGQAGKAYGEGWKAIWGGKPAPKPEKPEDKPKSAPAVGSFHND